MEKSCGIPTEMKTHFTSISATYKQCCIAARAAAKKIRQATYFDSRSNDRGKKAKHRLRYSGIISDTRL